MDNMEKQAHYLDLADQWQARIDEETGKTLANGWTSWEIYCADKRADYCRQKRDDCLAKAGK